MMKNNKKKMFNKKKINKLYDQNSLSTNIIKEAYEDIYLNVKNQFLKYKETGDRLIKIKYIDDTFITYNTNFNKYKKELTNMKSNNKLVKEIKLLDPSKSLIQQKYIPKNKRIITGINITNKISFNNEDIKFNTPIVIYYDEKAFRISGNNCVNRWECTWKCQNLREKIKNNNTIKYILIILIIKVNIRKY